MPSLRFKCRQSREGIATTRELCCLKILRLSDQDFNSGNCIFKILHTVALEVNTFYDHKISILSTELKKMLVQTQPGFPNTPIARIPLQNGLFALVDPDWFDRLNRYHWYAKKSFGCLYACRKVTNKGHVFFIRMHRVVANTPDNLVCHHINGNSLDNRRANLKNMTQFEHAKYYSWR